jgi:hypothetical protein
MPDWLADDAESTGYSPDEARTHREVEMKMQASPLRRE